MEPRDSLKSQANQGEMTMTYQAIYKDEVGHVVTELVEGSYEYVWGYCSLKTVDSISREFMIVEVKA